MLPEQRRRSTVEKCDSDICGTGTDAVASVAREHEMTSMSHRDSPSLFARKTQESSKPQHEDCRPEKSGQRHSTQTGLARLRSSPFAYAVVRTHRTGGGGPGEEEKKFTCAPKNHKIFGWLGRISTPITQPHVRFSLLPLNPLSSLILTRP